MRQRVARKAKNKTKTKSRKHPQGKASGMAVKCVQAPVYPLEDVFSLDVECVAVGRTHEKSDREPCSLALVNGFGRNVMHTLIKPVKPVVSYLTPFTGLREGDLDTDSSISLKRAVAELKGHLSRRSILVGQNPEGDAEWMRLRRGADFQGLVDLSEVFTNDRGMVFSLRHEALALLGKDAPAGTHDPSWDAAVSMDLYLLAMKASAKELEKMREKLTSKAVWPPKPSLARECGYQIDGVCLSCYVAEHCSCGRPIQGRTK